MTKRFQVKLRQPKTHEVKAKVKSSQCLVTLKGNVVHLKVVSGSECAPFKFSTKRTNPLSAKNLPQHTKPFAFGITFKEATNFYVSKVDPNKGFLQGKTLQGY